MAALIRCSHPPAGELSGDNRLNFGTLPSKFSTGVHAQDIFRRFDDVANIRTFHETTRRCFHHIKCDKAAGIYCEGFAYYKSQICLKRESVHLVSKSIQIGRSGEVHHLKEKLTLFYHDLVKLIFEDKRLNSLRLLSVCTFMNTLPFILPPESLADTCEAPTTLSSMPLLFGIAFIGATVGGLLARQRRGELERLNSQLRQINAALRRQAIKESFAPSLSYAPVGRVAESEIIVDPIKQQLITKLRTAKNFLRNDDLDKAFEGFKTALELAQNLGDPLEERKAARGLGATLRRQGKYKEAIKYYLMILEICKRIGDDSGSTEAYGAVADCYTELGDLERAGKFYDKYIARLETD